MNIPKSRTDLSIATSCVDLVDPAVAETVHARDRVNELITEDLPTFGKPTTAHVIPVLIPRRRAKAPKIFVNSSAPNADDPLTLFDRPMLVRCFWVDALNAIVGSWRRNTKQIFLRNFRKLNPKYRYMRCKLLYFLNFVIWAVDSPRGVLLHFKCHIPHAYRKPLS